MIREKLVPVAWLMTAAVIIGASIGFAARAHALPADQAFIETLDQYGVAYSSSDAAISLAHSICADLDRGVSITAEIVAGQLAGGYSRGDAEVIVGAAIGALCPRHMRQVALPVAAPPTLTDRVGGRIA